MPGIWEIRLGLAPGYCACGCGQRTKPAPMTSRARGLRKGDPQLHVHGHYRRSGTRHYRVDPATDCWEWMGALDNGYGRTRVKGRVYMAHRFFWEQRNGEIPPGLVLDHLCRNRACVNPDHLEVVTKGVNSRRGLRTKLTEEHVRVIRKVVRELATTYGVSIRTICNVADGQNWRHVE